MQASYNPIFDMNHNILKVVKYATNVTEAHVRDLDNEGQLMSINRALGSIEFDMNGNISKVNDNFANLTGYSQAEIIGQHHSMFVDHAYRASHAYKLFWEKLNRGEFDSAIYKRLGKNGKIIWLQASYNPILDENGKPFKVVKFAIDITLQQVAAEALNMAVEETKAIVNLAKEGDLSTRIAMNGKLGQIAELCEGVNSLVDKISDIIIQVREAGETINTTANEISTGNNDLSSRTEEQASTLEETASSMEELASTVKQNADNAIQGSKLAVAASKIAQKGGNVVGAVVSTMESIDESSRRIADIISVIDGIAFQTNILALNAAVEAARAGDHGRGFAVVAGEVRNLAQRSASAAKDIKQLITDSVTKIEDGAKLVEDAGATMQEIVASVQHVTDIMGEIASASAEQSLGINQVNNAITQMEEVTQQNAALVEQSAASAESLVEQANNLMGRVNEFRLEGFSLTRSVSSPISIKVATKLSEARKARN